MELLLYHKFGEILDLDSSQDPDVWKDVNRLATKICNEANFITTIKKFVQHEARESRYSFGIMETFEGALDQVAVKKIAAQVPASTGAAQNEQRMSRAQKDDDKYEKDEMFKRRHHSCRVSADKQPLKTLQTNGMRSEDSERTPGQNRVQQNEKPRFFLLQSF